MFGLMSFGCFYAVEVGFVLGMYLVLGTWPVKKFAWSYLEDFRKIDRTRTTKYCH